MRSVCLALIKFLILFWQSESIERFSFECRKVIGFALTTLRDWFKKLAPLFHPIRSKTKTNRDLLVRVFPHFASATCSYFVFWLVHLIICLLCDWFYDTQLKTALVRQLFKTHFHLPMQIFLKSLFIIHKLFKSLNFHCWSYSKLSLKIGNNVGEQAYNWKLNWDVETSRRRIS